MKLSVQDKDRSDFKPLSIHGNAALESVITRHTYSLGTFKDNKRTAANFESADMVGLDFDGGLNIYEAQRLFKDYKHIIAPTKSHQTLKNGVKDDRFRVILFLSERITSSAIYKNTVKELLKQYPQADKACTDASRMFYKSKNVMYRKLTKGKLVDPVAHIEIVKETTNIQPPKVSDMKLYNKLGGITKGFLEKGAPDGEWHNKRIAAAFEIRRQGGTLEQATRLIEGITGHLTSDDKFHIEDVFENRDIEYAEESEDSDEFKMVSFEEYCEEESEPIEWLVEDLLMKGGLSIISGDAKLGKSTLARQLVSTVTTGGSFLGRKVKQGRAAYISIEEHRGLVKMQLINLGMDTKNFVIPSSKNKRKPTREQILSIAEAYKLDFIVIDTMGKMLEIEDLNSYKLVEPALEYFSNICRNTGVHIMFITHNNKGEGSGQGRMNGSAAIPAATDTNMILTASGDTRYMVANGRAVKPMKKQALRYDEERAIYNISLGGEYEQF